MGCGSSSIKESNSTITSKDSAPAKETTHQQQSETRPVRHHPVTATTSSTTILPKQTEVAHQKEGVSTSSSSNNSTVYIHPGRHTDPTKRGQEQLTAHSIQKELQKQSQQQQQQQVEYSLNSFSNTTRSSSSVQQPKSTFVHQTTSPVTIGTTVTTPTSGSLAYVATQHAIGKQKIIPNRSISTKAVYNTKVRSNNDLVTTEKNTDKVEYHKSTKVKFKEDLVVNEEEEEEVENKFSTSDEFLKNFDKEKGKNNNNSSSNEQQQQQNSQQKPEERQKKPKQQQQQPQPQKEKKKTKPQQLSRLPSINTQLRLNRMGDVPQPGSESGKSFEECYKLKGVLGTGAFSTVREGEHTGCDDGRTFAVKCINRSKLSEEDEAALLDEVSILKEMNHVHIIRLYDFFDEPSTYYLVMERMSGGELFDRIVSKAYYNEKEARDTCKIILEAVSYCHKHNVAHRDLKPENLLLLSEDDDSAVKIADFGFAKKCAEPNSLTTQCGTPGYVAPEILEAVPYDTKSDMWSVGVILYILLGGYPPFIENNQRDLFRKIRRGDYEFHDEYWGAVSTGAKDLISSLLTVDPAVRLDAEQALHNDWICQDNESLEKKDLGANLTEFKKFNAKRKFKAAVKSVVAVNKLQSLGKDFLKQLAEGGK